MSDKEKKAAKNPKEVVTPKFRVSFPQVFEPKSFQGQEAKFSCVMLFDKSTDLTDLKKAVHAAATERWGDKSKWPKGMKLPFRDGDDKADQVGYENTTYVTANSKQRPGVVDQKARPIAKEDQSFYAGCYARAQLFAFAYPKEGVKGIAPGVAFGLQHIQKLNDGEPFSGRKRAEDVFDSVDDDSENSDSDLDDEFGDL